MNKYDILYAKSFRKDLKKFQHDRKFLDEMEKIIDRLANDKTLEAKYRDHALTGNMKGYRDCHIRPDVVLIYKKEAGILVMTCARVGSHANVLDD